MIRCRAGLIWVTYAHRRVCCDEWNVVYSAESLWLSLIIIMMMNMNLGSCSHHWCGQHLIRYIWRRPLMNINEHVLLLLGNQRVVSCIVDICELAWLEALWTFRIVVERWRLYKAAGLEVFTSIFTGEFIRLQYLSLIYCMLMNGRLILLQLFTVSHNLDFFP